MTQLYLAAEERDFSAPKALPDCVYKVLRYSKNQIGTYIQAAVTATGSDAEVWQLINYLRIPTTIKNSNGVVVWAGMISEVKITSGNISVSVTLDLMRNKVAVDYSSADGSLVGTTEYASDADSIATFGIREIVESLPSSDLAQAINFRDTLLSLRKKPVPAWQVSGSAREASAEITLRGFWSTLDWRYYTASETQQEVEGINGNEQAFGFYGSSTLFSYSAQYRTMYHSDSPAAVAAMGFHLMPEGAVFKITTTGAGSSLSNKTFLSRGQYKNLYETTRSDFTISGSTISCEDYTFTDIREGDHIRILGSASNDGHYVVQSVFRNTFNSSLTVTTSLVAESPGAEITVRRGAKLSVQPISGTPVQELPNPATTVRLMQSTYAAQKFQLEALSTLDVAAVRIKLRRSDPVANTSQFMQVWVTQDDGGIPGTMLPNGSSSATLESLPVTTEWVTFEFSPPFNLVSGTDYWIYMYRTVDSGTDHPGQIILATDNTDPYAGGYFAIFEPSNNWIPYNGNDLLFGLAGASQTTEMLESIITDAGQFFQSVTIEDDSGVNARLGRNGDKTALQETMSLINIGTSNNKPLLASIDEDRNVVIYEEPDATEVYRLEADGTLYNSMMVEVDPTECPVAFWVRLHNVVPVEIDLDTISDPSLVFIEESEYDVTQNRLSLRPRGAQSPWSVTKLQRG